jgi:hypothetical protein
VSFDTGKDDERPRLARAGRGLAAVAAGVGNAVIGAALLAMILAVAGVSRADRGAQVLVCLAGGAIFGALARPLGVARSPRGATLLGLAVGLAAELVDVGAAGPPLVRWLAHLAYGLAFALYPLLYRAPDEAQDGAAPDWKDRRIR